MSIREHIEACRRHIEVGAMISPSGAKALIEEIDRLRAALAHYARERGIAGTVAREALKEQ